MMKVLFGIFLITALLGCDKDALGPKYNTSEDTQLEYDTPSFAVVNEGNFGWSNSSLSIYYSDLNKVINQVFFNENEQTLGDVAQSVSLFNKQLYVVVNNSGKIEILDTTFFKVKHTITGFMSPRYIAEVGLSKAYVTDLYADKITICNVESNQIVGSINVGEWTENIQYFNGRVFITLPESGQIIEIDPQTDQIVDAIQLTTGATSFVVDKNDKLWVMCNGGINDVQPKLYKIGLNGLSIEDSINVAGVNESPGNLVIDGAGDFLYYTINSSLYKMSIQASVASTHAIYSLSNGNFYSLYFDKITSKLYASDVKDYIQPSTIHVVDHNGAYLHDFNVGVIAGNIMRVK